MIQSHRQKADLFQVVNFTDKLSNFIKLQRACQSLATLSFPDLLPLVETICSKPFDNKF